MIKVGILGASGYAGADLIRLLIQRDDVELVFADANRNGGEEISKFYPNLRGLDMKFTSLDIEDNEYFDKIDVLFCALPHGLTQKTVKAAMARKDLRVIDLSADFRLDDVDVYTSWYDTPHTAQEELKEAVYGLPELNRDRIKDARLIANPGCYPTSVILGLYPLMAEGHVSGNIIADSKSGVSGAGRGLKDPNLFGQASESMKAYSPGSHRHSPEIAQELRKIRDEKINLLFSPHLVPMNRGILSTIYVENKDNLTRQDIIDLYNKYYKDEYFVRFMEEGLPETKAVAGSNFIDIGFAVDELSGHIIVVSAIDNLIKGASGQAIQNMNIMFGLDEKKGLDQVSMWP